MINVKQIAEWKQIYEELYHVSILEQDFIFRPIGREEYKEVILMDLDLGQFQEHICERTMIYPNDYDFSNGIAGVAVVLSDAILDASGLHLNQAEEILNACREEMLVFDYQIDCIIHEAFPEFSLEEISAWNVRKTMYYFSRAEWILSKLKGIVLKAEDDESEGQQLQMPPQTGNKEFYQESYRNSVQEEFVEEPKKTNIKPSKQNSSEAGAIQTEEELLAMIAESGAKISTPITSMDGIKPELTWFQYVDELKGEFD